MALASATLNGLTVTEVRVSIPAWGASYADVTLDKEVSISGAVTLVVADLTIKGTVLAGGAGTGKSYFRLVAGAGGWGRTIPRKSYQNDAGVKLATVLGDAAREAGETLDATTIDAQERIGPAFVRPDGPASRVLEMFKPGAWYVGEDAVTRIGARAASTLATTAIRTSELDLAAGTLTIASDTIASILPGIAVDGLTAIDVEHELSLSNGLRSKLWGKLASSGDRRLAAFRALLDQLDPLRKFRGVSEYRVVTQTANRLNLQTVRVSTGMPDLANVVMRPGIAGANMKPALGSRVLVGFVDADPARPVVLGFEDPDGPGFVPISLTLGTAGSGAAVGRVGDSINAGYIVFTSTGTLVGSPPNVAAFPGTAAGLVAANAAAGALTPPGIVLKVDTGEITSGSSIVKVG